MSLDFLIFVVVGFLAQIVDGALGMAYGVVSTTVLLSFGVAPASASASVHAAELFTTLASAGSHLWHGNVDKRLFWRLAPAGVVGGIVGVFVLTSIDGATIKPFIVAYMAVMGVVIVWRTLRAIKPRHELPRGVEPLGLLGGFVDAVGGGGWGPVVTTTLVGAGGQPRYVIGTVNTAEFFPYGRRLGHVRRRACDGTLGRCRRLDAERDRRRRPDRWRTARGTAGRLCGETDLAENARRERWRSRPHSRRLPDHPADRLSGGPKTQNGRGEPRPSAISFE